MSRSWAETLVFENPSLAEVHYGDRQWKQQFLDVRCMLFCRFRSCVEQTCSTNHCQMVLVLAATARDGRFPCRPGLGLVSSALVQFSRHSQQAQGSARPPTVAALLLTHSFNSNFHSFPPFFSQECEGALGLLFPDPKKASQSLSGLGGTRRWHISTAGSSAWWLLLASSVNFLF